MDCKSQGQGMLGLNVLLAQQQKYQHFGDSNSDGSYLHDAEQGKQIYYHHSVKKARLDIKGSQKTPHDILDEKLDSSHQDDSKIKFVSLDSLLPAEAVFTIEKIRNKIISEISYKDLTNCRLVCRTWSQYATGDTMLTWEQNRICIGINKVCGTQNFTVWNRLKSRQIPLQQLTEIMDFTGVRIFPCNSLAISGTQFTDIDAVLNEFLDKHGFRFKKLRLNLDYVEPTKSMPFGINKYVTWGDREGVIKIKFFARLLQKQLINLEALSLNVTTREKSSNARVISLVNSTENEIIPGVFNFNLQSVTFTGGNIPHPLFESICNLAPNLREFNTTDLSWYLSPKNRLALCTFLIFSPAQSSFRKGDPLGIIANMDGNLQVKTIQVGPFLSSSHPTELPVCRCCIAAVFIKILNKCINTLESLIVDRMTFLSGFKIPTMPKVKFIDFRDNIYARSGVPYFPKGIHVSESFPNLQTVQISFCDADQWKNVKSFLTCCDEQVIPSVKLVNTACKQGWYMTLLLHLFPNAVVKEYVGITCMIE